MKNTILIALFATLAWAVNAQVSASSQVVDASEVPQAVQDAQASNFSGVTVNRWEKQSSTARTKSKTRYVAVFKKDGQNARARYHADGKGIYATVYYTAATLPQAIKDAASTNYSGYSLRNGEEVTYFKNGSSFFRIRLRKGAQKLVVYVDENGAEKQKNEVPSEVTTDESVD